MTVELEHTKVEVTHYVTRGVPELEEAEHVSVCLTRGRIQPQLSVVRNGITNNYPISGLVAAELIAHGIPYQG